MSARIEVTSGPLAGKVLPVRGSSFTIGREAGNDLVLEDGTVSRRHVVIVPDPSGASIRDLGSRNGITLEGKSAREGRLAHGTAFSVGRISCRYLFEAQASPPKTLVPAKRIPGGGFDRRFALVSSVALLLVAMILFLWYRKAHERGPQEAVVSLMQEEERYQPLEKPLQDCVVKDLKGEGVVRILKRYKSALSFRAMAQGDCDLELRYEDGTGSVLKVSVRGVKSPPVGMEIPPEILGDASREEEHFKLKMAEATARAAEGKLRDALVIARVIEGFYYSRMPKPAVAVEARNQALQWEARLQERLDRLEEERRHQSELRNYEAVEKALWSMRELVEDRSAEHQRLQYIKKVNDLNLRTAKEGR